MAVRTINLSPGVPNTRQRVVLDGREYVLALRWSQREARFYLDLADATGAPLISAMKLLPGWPLLYRHRGIDGVPPGELMVLDPRPTPAPPGLDELGDVMQLAYIDAADVATLAAGQTPAVTAPAGGVIG